MTLFTPWVRDSGQVPAGAVRPVPIAAVHVGPQGLRPGGLALPRPGVLPLLCECPVHAPDPAVLPGAVGPRVLAPDAAGLQGLVEEAAAVAGPVVGHDALDGHPARGGEGDRRRREGLADPVLDVGRGELRQRAGAARAVGHRLAGPRPREPFAGGPPARANLARDIGRRLADLDAGDHALPPLGREPCAGMLGHGRAPSP